MSIETDDLATSLRCAEFLVDSPYTSSMAFVTQKFSSLNRLKRRSARVSLGNISGATVNTHNNQLTMNTSRKRSIQNLVNTAQHPSVLPLADRGIAFNPPVLQNMHLAESAASLNSNYFTSIQEEVRPVHRERAVEWMYDVSKEENCDADIFVLAVVLMDRLLSTQNIFKDSIQSLAGVCLFIASKMKAPVPINAQRMAYYTADSVSVSQLLSWELLVMSTLEWDVSTPTAFDFFDQLCSRLRPLNFVRDLFTVIVHQMQKSCKLGTLLPSIQCAVAAIHAVHCYVDQHRRPVLSDPIRQISSVLSVDMEIPMSYLSHFGNAAMTDCTSQVPSPFAPPPTCRTPSSSFSNCQLIATVPDTPSVDSGFSSGVSSPESVSAKELDCSPPKMARLSY